MKRIGRYLVEESRLDGSLVARDEALDRRVVIQLLGTEASAQARARFERNARAAAAIEHPNLARILEVGEVDGTMFVASEHVGGRTLGQVAPQASVKKVERWLVQIAHGIRAIHAAGVVHRGIDEEHVRIDQDDVARLVAPSTARFELDDSFRTRTVDRREADTPAHDRMRWGAVALAALGDRPSRLTSLATRAMDGRFASIDALVAELAARKRRKPWTLFLAATLCTAATVLALLVGLGVPKLSEPTHVRALPPRRSLASAPPEVAVPSVAQTAPPPASSSAPRSNSGAGSAHARIDPRTFSPENHAKVDAFVRNNSARIIACSRTPAPKKLEVTVEVALDGHIVSVVSDGAWAETHCFYDPIVDHWPNIPITPDQGPTAMFYIDVRTGAP